MLLSFLKKNSTIQPDTGYPANSVSGATLEITIHTTGGAEAAASATAEIDREIANCTLDLGNQVRRVVNEKKQEQLSR